MLVSFYQRLAAYTAQVLLAMIRAYQWVLSPWVGRQCRFYPTCSHYAHQAISCHGAGRGSVLAVRRLLRCHPFHPGGVDEVPAVAGAYGAATDAEPSLNPSQSCIAQPRNS